MKKAIFCNLVFPSRGPDLHMFGIAVPGLMKFKAGLNQTRSQECWWKNGETRLTSFFQFESIWNRQQNNCRTLFSLWEKHHQWKCSWIVSFYPQPANKKETVEMFCQKVCLGKKSKCLVEDVTFQDRKDPCWQVFLLTQLKIPPSWSLFFNAFSVHGHSL